MTFQLIGELVKKDFRTSRSGNEYVMFNILSPEDKEFDIIGFSKVAEQLKSIDVGSLIQANGHIDSEAKQTNSGGRFINLKLISNEVFNLKNKTEIDVSNISPGNGIDNIPF